MKSKTETNPDFDFVGEQLSSSEMFDHVLNNENGNLSFYKFSMTEDGPKQSGMIIVLDADDIHKMVTGDMDGDPIQGFRPMTECGIKHPEDGTAIEQCYLAVTRPAQALLKEVVDTDKLRERISERLAQRAVEGMQKEGVPEDVIPLLLREIRSSLAASDADGNEEALRKRDSIDALDRLIRKLETKDGVLEA